MISWARLGCQVTVLRVEQGWQHGVDRKRDTRREHRDQRQFNLLNALTGGIEMALMD
jgi:hypothetical protein